MTERWRANGEEWISRWSWFCLEQGKLVSGADLIWSGSSLGGVMSCHLVWSVVWCWTLTLISPSWSSVLLEFCVFNLIFRFPPPLFLYWYGEGHWHGFLSFRCGIWRCGTGQVGLRVYDRYPARHSINYKSTNFPPSLFPITTQKEVKE